MLFYGILTVDRSYFGIRVRKKKFVVKAFSGRHLNCLKAFHCGKRVHRQKEASLIFSKSEIQKKSLKQAILAYI